MIHQGSRLPAGLTTGVVATALCAGVGVVFLMPLSLPWPVHLLAAAATAVGLTAALVQGAQQAVDRACRNAMVDNMLDPLTRLATPRLAELSLEAEFAAAQRGRPLSVVLLRVEGYRRFTTMHGRAMGDSLLRSTSRIVRRHTRNMHLAAHHSQGEATFIVLLSDVPLKGACIYGKRVRRDLMDQTGFPSPIAVSAGIAAYEPDISEPAELLQRAERALEKASAEGGRIIAIGRKSGLPQD
ncbi:hypothetical protein BH23GEM9_BH23GEM9_23830 [soil metagenome]